MSHNPLEYDKDADDGALENATTFGKRLEHVKNWLIHVCNAVSNPELEMPLEERQSYINRYRLDKIHPIADQGGARYIGGGQGRCRDYTEKAGLRWKTLLGIL